MSTRTLCDECREAWPYDEFMWLHGPDTTPRRFAIGDQVVATIDIEELTEVGHPDPHRWVFEVVGLIHPEHVDKRATKGRGPAYEISCMYGCGHVYGSSALQKATPAQIAAGPDLGAVK